MLPSFWRCTMKKVLIALIVIIIGIFSYTQLQLNSKQEKEDLKVQEALKNEAEVFIKAKEFSYQYW